MARPLRRVNSIKGCRDGEERGIQSSKLLASATSSGGECEQHRPLHPPSVSTHSVPAALSIQLMKAWQPYLRHGHTWVCIRRCDLPVGPWFRDRDDGGSPRMAGRPRDWLTRTAQNSALRPACPSRPRKPSFPTLPLGSLAPCLCLCFPATPVPPLLWSCRISIRHAAGPPGSRSQRGLLWPPAPPPPPPMLCLSSAACQHSARPPVGPPAPRAGLDLIFKPRPATA